MKYSAVIVTRNRIDLLKLALEKLLEQTLPLDHIIIVDNVSDDGTIEFLHSIKSEKILPIFAEKNEGGAGGFYRGIKHAYEIGSDYIWIMDDDTIATPTALEELIKGFKILKDRDVGFITSNVRYKDYTPCLMNISNCNFVWNEFAQDGLIRVNHSSFVSMLIPRRVVREFGLPFKEFFIWGDDGEYSTRIAQHMEGYVSARSIVFHYMNDNKGVDIFNTPHDRIDRFYYFYRNWMFTNKFRGKEQAKHYVRETKRLIRDIRKSSTPCKREKIKTIKRGLKDGKAMNWSIDFPDGISPKNENIPKHRKGIKGFVYKAIRKILLKINNRFNQKFTYTKKQYNRYVRAKHSLRERVLFLLKGLFRAEVINRGSKVLSFNELLKRVKIDLSLNKTFFCSIDFYKNWEIFNRQMDNCPPDYSLFIDNSLLSLKYDGDSDVEFEKNNNVIIDSIILYIQRVIKKIKHSRFANKKRLMTWLNNFINEPAKDLGDALQRIIIINQLLWQTGHRLVSYGRLDYILDDVIKKDTSSDEEIIELLCDFLSAQHNYYELKSDELVGDTGQAIILGGKNEEGETFSNKLTHLFIAASEKLMIPDPKLLLRVSEDTSREIWEKAISLVATGVGYPLFSNDDRVVPSLINFGYEKKDAYNYATSACWEPIPGMSHEQNNIQLINFTAPFDFISQKDDLDMMPTFEDYVFYYCEHLKGHANFMVRLLDHIEWDEDPLLSTCSISCREKKLDISKGGGKYNNYGVLSVGISNAVNSLLNVKKFVYDKKIFTLKELEDLRLNDFYGREDIVKLLSDSATAFGSDDEEVIGLTNYLTEQVNNSLEDYRNKFGGSVKFGLSSPSYLIIGKMTSATFDGRRANEPFGVHISADSGIAYTELMNFAANLDYSGRKFNGNVLDLMVSPSFIQDNFDNFTNLLIQGMKKGVYQLQINVVSSDMLIKAKKDPKFMPNLIVRVWGFSAYFNDLPEEYKDMLIERAKKNESACK